MDILGNVYENSERVKYKSKNLCVKRINQRKDGGREGC